MKMLFLLALIATSCSSNEFNQGAFSKKDAKAARSTSSPTADAQVAEETSLQSDLEKSLDYIKENYGDAEFTYNGQSFANMQSIMEDLVAADLKDLEPLDEAVEAEDKDWLFEKMSDYTLNYGSASRAESNVKLTLQSYTNMDARAKKAVALGYDLRGSSNAMNNALGATVHGIVARKLEQAPDDFPEDDRLGGPFGAILIGDDIWD